MNKTKMVGKKQPLILIADDNQHNLMLLGTFLRDNGYEVVEISQGAQALDYLVVPEVIVSKGHVPFSFLALSFSKSCLPLTKRPGSCSGTRTYRGESPVTFPLNRLIPPLLTLPSTRLSCELRVGRVALRFLGMIRALWMRA